MVPEDLVVWLEPCDPSEVTEPRPGLLCRRHADAMVVPVGWTLDDRREPMPRLFRPPTGPSTGGRDGTGPLRRPRRRAVDTPELFGTAPDDEPVTPAQSDDTAWTPRFDPDDDLGGLLAADSPLLSRAFRSRPRGGG
jgi:hypothetical protein